MSAPLGSRVSSAVPLSDRHAETEQDGPCLNEVVLVVFRCLKNSRTHFCECLLDRAIRAHVAKQCSDTPAGRANSGIRTPLAWVLMTNLYMTTKRVRAFGAWTKPLFLHTALSEPNIPTGGHDVESTPIPGTFIYDEYRKNPPDVFDHQKLATDVIGVSFDAQ